MSHQDGNFVTDWKTASQLCSLSESLNSEATADQLSSSGASKKRSFREEVQENQQKDEDLKDVFEYAEDLEQTEPTVRKTIKVTAEVEVHLEEAHKNRRIQKEKEERCSVTCGEGEQRRQVRCLNIRNEDASGCEIDKRPSASQTCKLQPCKQKEVYRKTPKGSSVAQIEPDVTEETPKGSSVAQIEPDVTEETPKGSSVAQIEPDVTEVDHIKKFHALRLRWGFGIAQSFIDHKACWHKSCNFKLNKTKLNRAEKQTSHERIDDKATTSKKKTRHSFSVQSTSNPSVCFFCNGNGQQDLLESSTFGQDTRLSAGDLIAQEAKYHSKCLVSLYNRASRIEMKNDNVESKKESQIHEDVQGVVQTFHQSEPMLKCQSKRVSLLPESYSNLPPAVLRFNEPDIPLVEGELSIDMSSFPAALKGEFKWLKHI
ncbi:ADAMTS9 [Mytilus edulis]|uniref:ADAMTS9 n=1 Tax=Mytilus edulis TaxID=6550 RepID=A0A8S3PNZ1_MYTED|nr:ADAMTS9 [Mytilus edulis]